MLNVICKFHYYLFFSFVAGHERVVHLLLRKGANTFHQDFDGNTALHKAAQNNHQSVMKLLLDSSSDSDRLQSICNNKGLRALDLSKQ